MGTTSLRVLKRMQLLLVCFFCFSCSDDEGENYDSPQEPSFVLDNSTVMSRGLKGDGTESSPYQISSAQDFMYFAEAIGSGDLESRGKYFRLECDLEVSSDYDWSAIGNNIIPFQGHFDGGSHAITGTLHHKTLQRKPDHFIFNGEVSSGDDLNSSLERFYWDGYYFGLFGCCSEGSVSNLRMEADVLINATVDDEASDRRIFIGSIMACASRVSEPTSMENCSVKNSVVDNGEHAISRTSCYAIGGACGATTGLVRNVSAEGSLSIGGGEYGQIFAGGIVGYCYGASDMKTGQIIECTNRTVIGWGEDAIYCDNAIVGGICGYAEAVYQIDGCTNSVDLQLGGLGAYQQTVGVTLGGIVGEMGKPQWGGVKILTNCSNEGNVTAPQHFGATNISAYTGGIAGIFWGDIDIMNPEEKSSFTQCTNTGVVTGAYYYSDISDYTGGIAGMVSNSSLTDCHNEAEVHAGGNGSTQYGGIVGHWKPETHTMHLCSNNGLLVGSGAETFYFGDLVGYLEVTGETVQPCIFDCCEYLGSEEQGVGNYRYLPDVVIFGSCDLGHD